MKEKIKALNSTPRGKALFKIMLYMIFLAFVFLIILLGNAFNENKNPSQTSSTRQSSNLSKQDESTKEITYKEKQTKLLTEDYKFKYFIRGSQETNFEGEKIGNNTYGYKETQNELIKYSIKNGIIYKHELNNESEYNLLFDGLDTNLFNFNYLFETLNQTSSTIEKNDDIKIYNYKNFSNYIVNVKTDKFHITSIIIKNEIIEYNFEFTY